MEKQITEWSYWAGLACAALAVVWRGLSIVGMMQVEFGTGGKAMGTITLYKAALLFFVVAIASANYVWSKEQK